MKLFAYDKDMASEKAKINTSKIGKLLPPIVAPRKDFIRAYDQSHLIIDKDVLIKTYNGAIFQTEEDLIFDPFSKEHNNVEHYEDIVGKYSPYNWATIDEILDSHDDNYYNDLIVRPLIRELNYDKDLLIGSYSNVSSCLISRIPYRDITLWLMDNNSKGSDTDKTDAWIMCSLYQGANVVKKGYDGYGSSGSLFSSYDIVGYNNVPAPVCAMIPGGLSLDKNGYHMNYHIPLDWASKDYVQVTSRVWGAGSKPYTAFNYQLLGGFTFGVYRVVDSYNRPLGKDNEPYGKDWQTNLNLGIIPNSVWTPLHRPKCWPGGMVYLGNNLWGDIGPLEKIPDFWEYFYNDGYNDLVNNPDMTTQSTAEEDWADVKGDDGEWHTVKHSLLEDKYGMRGTDRFDMNGFCELGYYERNMLAPHILTGSPTVAAPTKAVTLEDDIYQNTNNMRTQSHVTNTVVTVNTTDGTLHHKEYWEDATPLNWYGFIHAATLYGKRLPTYAEFCRAAIGCPNGEYCACNMTDDEYNDYLSGDLSYFSNIYSISSYNVKSLVGDVWKWCSDLLDIESTTTCQWNSVATAMRAGDFIDMGGMGDFYGPSKTSLRAVCAGGAYDSGDAAGRRAIDVSHTPWELNSHIGAWFVCDSL